MSPSTNLSLTPLIILLSDYPFTSNNTFSSFKRGKQKDKHEWILTKKKDLKGYFTIQHKYLSFWDKLGVIVDGK